MHVCVFGEGVNDDEANAQRQLEHRQGTVLNVDMCAYMCLGRVFVWMKPMGSDNCNTAKEQATLCVYLYVSCRSIWNYIIAILNDGNIIIYVL